MARLKPKAPVGNTSALGVLRVLVYPLGASCAEALEAHPRATQSSQRFDQGLGRRSSMGEREVTNEKKRSLGSAVWGGYLLG